MAEPVGAATGKPVKTKRAAQNLSPADVISRVEELLETRYRSADLGNLDDPLSETVYILLSKQTREGCYQGLFRKLRKLYPAWRDVLQADPGDLEVILTPGGFQHARARELLGILAAVAEDNERRCVGPAASPPSDLTLDYLRELPDEEVESFLTSLPGIGPKSARCVMSYALGRQRFAVDTHVHRIFERLAVVPMQNRKVDHDPLEAAIPLRSRRRLHMNLVHHGRAVCTSAKPKCGNCVLISFCAGGRARVAQVSGQKLTAVELFSGAGGLGTGFVQEGFKVTLAVELDRHAAQTYRANHPGTPVLEADIGKLTAREAIRFSPAAATPDVLLAGPPCQGYSVAGRRDSNDVRNRLFTHVSRLAKELRARYVVVENVHGLRNVDGVSFISRVKQSFVHRGFSISEYLLNAADFGVAQVRRRCVFIGRRSELGGAPPGPPVPSVQGTNRRLQHALMDLPEVGTGVIAEYLRTDAGSVLLNASTMAHSRRVTEKISKIAAGKGPLSYRRLGMDLASTLIAGHRALPVHPWLNRTISVREAARIQGFADTYVFCGPRSTQPLQVANAVPPPLAAAVARHITSLVRHGEKAPSAAMMPKRNLSPVRAAARPAVNGPDDVLRSDKEPLQTLTPAGVLKDQVALVAQ
jgi:DNA (cytosine-5)-methyltransferase 1